MDTAGDDRWRCANCGHVHESYNPPCLRCAGENLVRVGDADDGETRESVETDDQPTGPGSVRSPGPARGGSERPTSGGGPQPVTERWRESPPSVEYLCKSCGSRYPEQKTVCPNCDGTDLAAIREPSVSSDNSDDDWDVTASRSSGGLFETVSTLVAWAFGLLALFTGFGVLLIAFSEANVGVLASGILATAAGAVSLPPTRRRLFRRLGVDLSRGKLVALIVVLWVGGNLTLYATGTVPAGAV
ncbi:hypothetical protein [Haloarchaeobius sp. DT45]|uniref:hypothetical protein n=1 Tax=Haloarchaeobius sp. DT45 TaxID=3446116 RepID=UPI003F6A9114